MILTKEFKTRLMALKSAGKKTHYQQAMMVLGELGLGEKVSKQFRDDSRIPNCIKYELPDGYRLVCQSVENQPGEYLALFVGKHDEVDSFLDRHKGWIFNPATHALKELRLAEGQDEHVNLVKSSGLQQKLPTDDIIESQKQKLIFEGINSDQLLKAGVPPEKIEEALKLTDPDSIEAMLFLEDLPTRTVDLW